MTSSQVRMGLKSRVRPMISFTADKVRRQIGRVDNPEVRKARMLLRQARKDNIDILELGDSMVSFVAAYDTDKRPLHRMLKDAFDPGAQFVAVHGGSYNPPIYDQYLRLLEGTQSRPIIILPLTVRVRTLPWIEHPLYGHKRAVDFLTSVDAQGPLRKVRLGLTAPTADEFKRFRALKFPTWMGDLSIGDYILRAKDASLSKDDVAKILYAYHHGGEIVTGGSLDMVRALGERLRRLDVPVIVYQTPVPVEKGVELYGQSFYDLAERSFATLEDAFRAGYGDIETLKTGLNVPTEDFIDWRDGSEHVNDRGRSVIARAVIDAVNAVR